MVGSRENFFVEELQARSDDFVDIKPENVLTKLASDATLQRLEKHELEFPSKVIFDDGYPLYPTCGATSSLLELETVPVLTDFGTARSSKATHEGWGMAHSYRAPEVLLGLPWSCEIDIWSIGVMVRTLGQALTINGSGRD